MIVRARACARVCAHSHLLLCDVQHTFQGELLKVEAVTLVKVCADRLRVVVHHHRLLAHLPQGPDAGHGAPIKLHTAACLKATHKHKGPYKGIPSTNVYWF